MSRFRTIEISDPKFENGIRFITVKSSNLKGRGDICVYIPDIKKEISDLPIYILLHGVYGSAWCWSMKGGAAKTAQRLIAEQQIEPAIIAMPSDGLWGDGSAYFSHHQQHFDQWIVDDVPQAIIETIAAASENSKICICGLSMGGYGAMMLGARFPEKFAAISAHSSITKLKQMEQFVEEPIEAYTQHCALPDVVEAIRINKDRLPPLRFDCGKADGLIKANQRLHEQLVESKITHAYQVFEGGHEWSYWQKHVEKTFRFFDQVVHE